MTRLVVSLFLGLSTLLGAVAAQPMVNQIGKLPISKSGAHQMKFAIVGYGATAPAMATAAVANGRLTGVSVHSGGAGYLSAPVVTIVGGRGAGAKAKATVSGGEVTGIQVLAGGAGYTGLPEVRVALPSAKPSVTTLWSNDGTSVNGSEPQNAVTLQIVKGSYAALLGYTGLPNMQALPTEVLAAAGTRVRVWYRAGERFKAAPGDLPLQAVPYALSSEFASDSGNTIEQGSIGLSLLAPEVLARTLPADGSLSLDGALNLQGATFTRATSTFGAAEYTFKGRVDNGNVLSIQNTSFVNSFSAIAFRREDGQERMAMGWGNASAGGPWPSTGYIELSNFDGTPGMFQLVHTGNFGSIGSGVRYYRRLTVVPDGDMTFWQSLPMFVTAQKEALVIARDGLVTAAGKLRVGKSGTPAAAIRRGRATLAAGQITVSETSVTELSDIHVTVQSLGGVSVPQPIAVTARVAGQSFTVTSGSATDTSVIAWEMIEP